MAVPAAMRPAIAGTERDARPDAGADREAGGGAGDQADAQRAIGVALAREHADAQAGRETVGAAERGQADRFDRRVARAADRGAAEHAQRQPGQRAAGGLAIEAGKGRFIQARRERADDAGEPAADQRRHAVLRMHRLGVLGRRRAREAGERAAERRQRLVAARGRVDQHHRSGAEQPAEQLARRRHGRAPGIERESPRQQEAGRALRRGAEQRAAEHLAPGRVRDQPRRIERARDHQAVGDAVRGAESGERARVARRRPRTDAGAARRAQWRRSSRAAR